MIELFESISTKSREQAKFIFDRALEQQTIMAALKVLNDYLDACEGEERDFANFYFNLRFMELNNYENDSNQRQEPER